MTGQRVRGSIAYHYERIEQLKAMPDDSPSFVRTAKTEDQLYVTREERIAYNEKMIAKYIAQELCLGETE